MRPLHPLVSCLVLVVSACGRDEPRADVHIAKNAGTANAAAELGSGDVRITTVDGGVDLALLGDSISGGLSERTLGTVRREIDTGAVQGTGFGADIEKMVKGTVQGALTTRVAFPLSSIKDVRYEHGKIAFDWNGTPRLSGSMKTNKKDVLESFSPADAQRFVDAVRARKAQTR